MHANDIDEFVFTNYFFNNMYHLCGFCRLCTKV